ncbi:hypothetical protein O152_gp187 [Pseudomonas phage PaBG]|uniref:Uncharacterized protein n=1 Tax=Pseudomonas phage PaBG TaxID=1335230 RepID=S5VZT8_9CAUD|nr:hypothetical protein O152_gp187 [Pseudomonas phage PaBG]AGS82170.1 hypothetical protein PaBG_00299 [Pseudomonas phage PaBG]
MKRTHASLLSSAESLAAKFKQRYPNRQFSVKEQGEFQVGIDIKDSYVQVSLSIQNYAVSMQMGAESVTVTVSQAGPRLAWFFKKEQELRHRQRHARQAMRQHIQKLETAELLFENHTKIVRFDMVGFSGNRRACPAINIAFSEVPDRPFAQIIYNNYHNDRRKTAMRHSTYAVQFGGRWYACEKFSEVFALFDDARVLRDLDDAGAADNVQLLKMVDDNTNEQRQGRALIRASDLEVLAPYLLVMEPRNFQLHTGIMRNSIGMEGDEELKSKANLLFYHESEVQFYSCFAHTELAWDGSL